ncbi:hydroxymethylpyrimidine ABC transporter, ATPase component [Vibrio sp. JCM 19052]|nr:hydroxymethylpyrimidine ABC transporter, ATPase component [Vibrio sp. JCM 19052]
MCANALGIQLTEASLQYKDSQTPTLARLSMTIPPINGLFYLVAVVAEKRRSFVILLGC